MVFVLGIDIPLIELLLIIIALFTITLFFSLLTLVWLNKKEKDLLQETREIIKLEHHLHHRKPKIEKEDEKKSLFAGFFAPVNKSETWWERHKKKQAKKRVAKLPKIKVPTHSKSTWFQQHKKEKAKLPIFSVPNDISKGPTWSEKYKKQQEKHKVEYERDQEKKQAWLEKHKKIVEKHKVKRKPFHIIVKNEPQGSTWMETYKKKQAMHKKEREAELRKAQKERENRQKEEERRSKEAKIRNIKAKKQELSKPTWWEKYKKKQDRLKAEKPPIKIAKEAKKATWLEKHKRSIKKEKPKPFKFSFFRKEDNSKLTWSEKYKRRQAIKKKEEKLKLRINKAIATKKKNEKELKKEIETQKIKSKRKPFHIIIKDSPKKETWWEKYKKKQAKYKKEKEIIKFVEEPKKATWIQKHKRKIQREQPKKFKIPNIFKEDDNSKSTWSERYKRKQARLKKQDKAIKLPKFPKHADKRNTWLAKHKRKQSKIKPEFDIVKVWNNYWDQEIKKARERERNRRINRIKKEYMK